MRFGQGRKELRIDLECSYRDRDWPVCYIDFRGELGRQAFHCTCCRLCDRSITTGGVGERVSSGLGWGEHKDRE